VSALRRSRASKRRRHLRRAERNAARAASRAAQKHLAMLDVVALLVKFEEMVNAARAARTLERMAERERNAEKFIRFAERYGGPIRILGIGEQRVPLHLHKFSPV
jgi:hypothetical protein